LAQSFRKPRSSPPRKEPSRQEMPFRIQFSTRGLNILLNTKAAAVESQLFLLCEIDTTYGYLTSSSFRSVLFFSFFSRLTPVSLLERKLGFELALQLADIVKRPYSHL
jgi:hypothetical protein